jgi:hypothetical protein
MGGTMAKLEVVDGPRRCTTVGDLRAFLAAYDDSFPLGYRESGYLVSVECVETNTDNQWLIIDVD